MAEHSWVFGHVGFFVFEGRKQVSRQPSASSLTGDGHVRVVRSSATRPMKPFEELGLAWQLDKLRCRIQRLFRPLLQRAPEGTRLAHFDQMLAYYGSQPVSKNASARCVDKLLAEYNQIKQKLVLANLAWVTKMARGQRQWMVAEDDLFQEGVCGLLKAIDRFEPQRRFRLMTYATWYIREAMQQARARQSHPASISAHDHAMLGKLEAERIKFEQQHERTPTANELGDRLSANPRSVSRLQAIARPSLRLERGSGEDAIPVVVEDCVDEIAHREAVQMAVARLLEELPDRERMVVARRYGLEGHEPCSLAALSGDLNVSKERVRQLQRQAIRRIQKRVEQEQLEHLAV